MATDPVCGMSVNPAKTAGRIEHAGETHHFYSADCWFEFEANPGRFVAPAAAAMASSWLSAIVNSALLKRVKFSNS